MRKIIAIAAGAVMALSFSVGHADQTNGCVAQSDTGILTDGALTCSYIATASPGRITQATPNQVHVTVDDGTTVTTPYNQESLTEPGQATFATPPGSTVTVTVGPDDAYGFASGAIGFVAIGDAS